jgi:NAD(P)-dependent dehydrogenase (short-subunit alcohol dehydrogenase family)
MAEVKTALVTGAAQRIGRAITLELAARGWHVAVHYRHSREAADEVVRLAQARGVKAFALAAELGDEQDVHKLLPAAAAALGPITALVNNASVFEEDDAVTATRQSWDAHMDANLRAPFVLSQALAAQLPENAPGNIINIIDQRVWRLTPKFLSYTLSKAGLWTLTQTLAQSFAPKIRVNAIGPGPVLPSPRQSAEAFAAQAAAVPLKRATSPEEIARAVGFILETPSLTGQMIALDGGQHLSWQTPDVMLDE